jgi:hypothetical protein
MLTCKATFKLSKANEATTETLDLEAATDEELFGKIRAHAELANRKGYMVDGIAITTERHGKTDSCASGG